MANYALIQNGIVTNVIVADDQTTADLFGYAVEYTNKNPVGIGYSYDGISFSSPVQA